MDEAPWLACGQTASVTGSGRAAAHSLCVSLQKSEVVRTTAAADSPSSISPRAQVLTGLLIGAADEQTASQAKKEKYKQELLEQIAEQQRNKSLEKRLRGAAAADPGKQREHLVGRRRDVRYEPREGGSEHRGRSRQDPSAQAVHQEYHRDFSHLLGDVSTPRVPPLPPLPPLDAEYHYYGARDPLHPDTEPEHLHRPPPERRPPLGPGRHTQSESRVTDEHHVSLLEVGEPPAEKSKLMRERAQSYQEALRLQIREREDQKRREKEEKERYEAKIEAERMAFNPWGRSGAGAPIKDQNGNVVSDLKHMHRAQEGCRSPVCRESGHAQSFLMEQGDASAPAEPQPPARRRLSGLSDHPTPEKLHIQDRYKEELIQQMEEKKRKDKEAAERMKMEEEKDDKRQVEGMAINQRRYEEEEERRLEEERPGLKRGCEEEEKKRTEQRETKARVHEVQTPQEQKEAPRTYELKPRGSSPPIPAVQRRMENTEESPVTSDRPVSAPRFQPTADTPRFQPTADTPPFQPTADTPRFQPTADTPRFQPTADTPRFQPTADTPRFQPTADTPRFQPTADTPPLQESQQQEEVMRGLSALKSMLRNRQRHLELQLEKIERQEPLYVPSKPRRRPRIEAFESASARGNVQSVRQTNQWQHGGEASARGNVQSVRQTNQWQHGGEASARGNVQSVRQTNQWQHGAGMLLKSQSTIRGPPPVGDHTMKGRVREVDTSGQMFSRMFSRKLV
ncbi:hypothetical protein CgunFtcFv8_015996 [Champsocephalus gunnari]|uniref:Uncharacterized protein n=1 Tax=Champsocephalus gunnari TaxID=52237 RepID=A0AAN8CAW1_CHAGU|nr:hypothetical protein CgunFtcFv8_015996 [Champsocephalus gunnari]